MTCPRCGSKEIGKIGTVQYYCWRCCVEFSVTRKGTQLYQVDAEGGLVLIDGDEAGLPAADEFGSAVRTVRS